MQSQVAKALLEIGAVGFTPDAPITFKSGILSPVYVDNRRLIFWPPQWKVIIEGFRQLITEQNIDADVIAGIAAGGVPHSSALAYIMDKPSVFVRKEEKGHGMKNRVEGGDVNGRRVLLVEDLVTTGGSSLSGVQALRDQGAIIQDCIAIISYGFQEAEQAFAEASVRLHRLTTFPVVLDVALTDGRFGSAEKTIIEDWLDDPHGWAERQGK